MAGRTVTRADLYRAAYRVTGLAEREAGALVELVLVEITDALARGEAVKLASFGTFSTRRKHERIGRNPTTGDPARISPRTVVVYRPSQVLKSRLQFALAEKERPEPLRNLAAGSAQLEPR